MQCNRTLAQERRKGPDRISKANRDKHIRPLSRENLAAVLAASQRWCTRRDAALYLTLADTGVRPSEALALQWRDVDLVARTLHVERALSTTGTIKTTRTEGSRDVDMTKRLAVTLRDLQTSGEADAFLAGTTPSPFCFTTARGAASCADESPSRPPSGEGLDRPRGAGA